MPPSSAPPDDAAPRTVPFAGLRRNARALAGGALLLVALALLPDLTPAIAPSIALVSIRLAFVGALNGVRSPLGHEP